MSLRIAVISTPFFKLPVPNYSGLEHLAYQQAEGLAKLGHKTSLVAPEGSVCPNVEIISIGPERTVDEKRAFGIYKERLKDFDAVIDNSWQKWTYVAKMEGWLKCPVLGICHAPVNTMYTSIPPIEKPCFVCISNDQRIHFEALFSREARTAHNGVDPEFYKPMEGIKRTDRLRFLARFSTIKGPHTCIEACKRMNTKLDLIGDTTITNEPEYLQHCKNMADGKQIKIVGPAIRGECVRWFSQAFCFLHANYLFREPFGLAPVESMLCQNPVICVDYGAMRETVKHGETGYICKRDEDFTNGICWFLDQTEHSRKVIRENCREWAMQFSIDNMIKRYEELCIEAVETGGW